MVDLANLQDYIKLTAPEEKTKLRKKENSYIISYTEIVIISYTEIEIKSHLAT